MEHPTFDNIDIENVMILDVETTGLDSKKNKIIEIAALLYNVPNRCVLQSVSTLIPVQENPVEHINGIKAAHSMLINDSIGVRHGVNTALRYMIFQSHAIVAHNADFDKGFLRDNPIDYENEPMTINGLPWICTYKHFEWPEVKGSKRLTNIAQELGIDTAGAHRALADCFLIAKCFDKIHNLPERLKAAYVKQNINRNKEAVVNE